MVEISNLKIGTRVKVIDEWLPDYICDEVDEMDNFLGQEVVVSYIGSLGETVQIEGCGYWFNKYCFDYIIDDSEEIDPPDMGGI